MMHHMCMGWFCALPRWATRVFLCILVLACCLAYRDACATPAARIVYTADTHGYLRPCASCAGGALGGLARRASLVSRLMAESPRTLALAGPDEFHPDMAAGDASGQRAAALHAAFTKIPYTAVYLAAGTVEGLRKLGISPLPVGVVVAGKPVIHYFRAGRFTAGCVFLPPGEGNAGTPTTEQVLAAQQAAGEAAVSASLVIAVSPWGMYAENALMDRLAGHFHIVLGGGPGIAIPGQAMGTAGAPGPLWARSDRMGRAVTVLDIHTLPEPRTPWIEGINFSSRLELLDAALPEDEAVRNIVNAVPGE